MISAGSIGLPLHPGRVPSFLTERMGRMGNAVIRSIVDNYGKSEVLTRMSDPNWFQAFGSLIGMQWNSSGVTAVVLGSLKRHINPDAKNLGLYILGGKGKGMWATDRQVQSVARAKNLDGTALVKASKLTKRIDQNAIQDGFNLYQQYFLLSDEGEWTAITQGLNTRNRRARRYHWHSPGVRSFSDNPHKGIAGTQQQMILNFVDPGAQQLRDNVVSLVTKNRKEVLEAVRDNELPQRHEIRKEDVNLARLGSILDLAYDRQIENFDDLVELHGVGPRTLKALALASEVIHGDSTRFEDPARFAFAVGGKDGRPHPIDKESMKEATDHLEDSLRRSKLNDKDKSSALKRLHKIAVDGEAKGTPLDFLEQLIENEWEKAEQGDGLTFMGGVVKGLTRKIMDKQNSWLYGDSGEK